ncbi:MAG TPA: DEAD/DEAH box helicase [Bacteroidales bacterium]|nr:DEAD/DEAH box helicase [Bacteroidales bacterium]
MEPGSEKKKKLFAIVLTQHRIWGYILLPYIIRNDNGFYALSECLSPFPSLDTLSTLNDDEREVVKILNEYTDRDLFKLFSRDKNVKEFTEKVTPDKIEKFIRPYIERRVFKCLTIAINEDIPVYFRRIKTATLHSDDRLILASEHAFPVFNFERTPEQTIYRLSLESAGKQINLKDSDSEILTMSPCVIFHDHTIYFVADIDGSKIKPFLTKESIVIPKKNELQYFRTFVLNAVNNFKVEGSGFTITFFEPEKKAVVQLENGIKGYVLLLNYDYAGNRIFASEPSVFFTIFEKTGPDFIFKKYKRDFDWEKTQRDILGELGFFSEDDIHFSPVQEENRKRDELYSLIESVNRSFRDLEEAGFIVISKFDINYNLQPVNIEISSELVNDWFDLRATVKIGEWTIPFIRFRKNILENIREFVLPDGSVAILPETWFTKYRNIFELGKTEKDNLRIHKQHFSLLGDVTKEPQGFKKLQKLLVPEEIPQIPIPSGLKCNLRQYQYEGLNWLTFLQNARLGGCLADDMGLGKTIQTLALLQHNKETSSDVVNTPLSGETDLFSQVETVQKRLTSLLIVPSSLVYNWENEIRRFTPDLRVCSYKGVQRKKTNSYFGEFDIIISSYHTVRQDIEIMSAFNFHYIILDESQLIKNPGSMLYKTFVRLKSEYKLVLTGTPVENSLTDLWTQLNFVNPGLLGDLSFFRREFSRPIELQGDDEKEKRLRKIIQPFILRRTKEMVAADLPPVTDQTVYCEMTDEQAKIYDEEKSAVRNSILNNVASQGLEKSAIMVLQGLMRLRQISNHPSMALDDYEFGSGKFDTVMQDIESVISENHKILIFSSFVRHLDLFALELTKRRIGYSMLTGSSTNREKIVSGFQDDPERRIFLISLKAGGVGLNLTAADYVFILDPWWNPASEMQALSRAHRIGQDKNVFVYRYITSNSIEEKISRLQEKKSKLAETFIASNNPLKDINVEEILSLIE